MLILQKRLDGIQAVLLCGLLQACAENTLYAPVTTNSQNLSIINQSPPAWRARDTDPSEKTLANPVIENVETQPDTAIDSTAESKSYTVPEHSVIHKPSRPHTRINRHDGYYHSAPKTAITKPRASLPDDKAKFHVVKKGETLFSIGNRSGYPYLQLAQWNGLSVPYTMTEGRKLQLFANQVKTFYKHDADQANYFIKTRHKKEKTPFVSIDSDDSSEAASHPRETRHKTHPGKSNTLKTATISIDNKKMLKLAFEWPLKGVVVKNFQQSKNKGIDIAGEVGQRVYAAESGRVIYGGPWLIGFGNLLIIKHNPTYLSAYANNSQLFVKEGQRVNKGQVVARVGRTLSRKKAALHFEIRKNGKSVNPLRLLPSL